MALSVRSFRCRSDNIGLLVGNDASGEALLVDAPAEEPIVREVEASGWVPSAVLVTHHHSDHTAAILALKSRFGLRVLGPAAEADRIPGIDELLPSEGVLRMLGEEIRIIPTPGHTRGHLSYYFSAAGMVFTGDTLFALGCGRLVECDAPTMLASLHRLRALPPQTLLWCGHDYFEKNARFALTLEPENAGLRERATLARGLAADKTVPSPSTIGLETATNPFLRWDSPALRVGLGLAGAADVDVFAETRRRRDTF